VEDDVAAFGLALVGPGLRDVEGHDLVVVLPETAVGEGVHDCLGQIVGVRLLRVVLRSGRLEVAVGPQVGLGPGEAEVESQEEGLGDRRRTDEGGCGLFDGGLPIVGGLRGVDTNKAAYARGFGSRLGLWFPQHVEGDGRQLRSRPCR
jgi:hypothetical protein